MLYKAGLCPYKKGMRDFILAGQSVSFEFLVGILAVGRCQDGLVPVLMLVPIKTYVEKSLT